MTHLDVQKIKEYVRCPQFGDDEYGKWGGLSFEVRKTINDLCDWALYLDKTLEECLWTRQEISPIDENDKYYDYVNATYNEDQLRLKLNEVINYINRCEKDENTKRIHNKRQENNHR